MWAQFFLKHAFYEKATADSTTMVSNISHLNFATWADKPLSQVFFTPKLSSEVSPAYVPSGSHKLMTGMQLYVAMITFVLLIAKHIFLLSYYF